MATGQAGGGGGGDRQDYLFPIERLTSLSKWADISAQLAANNFLARPLKLDDYERGYVELLKQLTVVGQVDKRAFEARFEEMRRINRLDEHYVVVVIEDQAANRVVGCSTLFLEYKVIRNCSMRGRLEDVAVLDTCRGRRVGELVVSLIVELAHESYKCYKLTLDCKDELKNFYAKNNFVYGSNMLELRFNQ